MIENKLKSENSTNLSLINMEKHFANTLLFCFLVADFVDLLTKNGSFQKSFEKSRLRRAILYISPKF